MSLWEMLVFLAVANVLSFGNGTYMVGLLQHQFVTDTHMLSNEQLLYAFALARVTPGQANLYVASLGYMMFGFPGAALSMVVIAAPSYLMLGLMRGYAYFRDNRYVFGFSRGLACTAVGLVLATTWNLAKDSLSTPVAWLVLGVSIGLLVLTKLPTVVSLLLAAAVGVVTVLAFGLA